MLVSGASLVGAEHPLLQQRNGQVDTRQQFVLAFRLMSLHLPIMNISLQFPVRIEAVGANGASGLNALPDEAMKGFAIKIWDTRHADTPNSPAISFSGHDNHCFVQNSAPSWLHQIPLCPNTFHPLQRPHAAARDPASPWPVAVYGASARLFGSCPSRESAAIP